MYQCRMIHFDLGDVWEGEWVYKSPDDIIAMVVDTYITLYRFRLTQLRARDSSHLLVLWTGDSWRVIETRIVK